jgi:hypothetical protein
VNNEHESSCTQCPTVYKIRLCPGQLPLARAVACGATKSKKVSDGRRHFPFLTILLLGPWHIRCYFNQYMCTYSGKGQTFTQGEARSASGLARIST